MSLILTGDQNNVSQELTDAEVNHLRRLLAWLTCEYNLSEAAANPRLRNHKWHALPTAKET